MRISVRVRPGSSRTRVGGSRDGVLVVAVQAPAVDGRATQAAVEAVAEAFGLKARDVQLVSGERSRTKILELDGDSEALHRRLTELVDQG